MNAMLAVLALDLTVLAGEVVTRAATAWHARDLRRADQVAARWAADPANWCTHPGCPRCIGGAW